MNKLRFIIPCLIFSGFCFGQSAFDQGVDAYNKNDYERAIRLLRQAEPGRAGRADVHSYLGAAYKRLSEFYAMLAEMVKDPSTSDSVLPEGRAMAAKVPAMIPETERMAEVELRRALAIDPNNKLALETFVDLAYRGNAVLTAPEKERRLAEAKVFDDRLTVAFASESTARLTQLLVQTRRTSSNDPNGSRHAHEGEVITASCDEVLHRANPWRTGPIPDPMRQMLKEKLAEFLNEALADFQNALQLNPGNAQAMMGMGNLIRDQAMLRDSQAEYDAEITNAQAWIDRGSNARDAQGAVPRNAPVSAGQTQAANLIRMVTPSYPLAAVQAHVTGSVRFKVTIGKDGTPSSIQILMGHPMLAAAATEALKQWVWKPTFANNGPIEVETEVDVRFSGGN